MKLLLNYTKNSYQFSLLVRQGEFAIFAGRKEGCRATNYEVVRLSVTPSGSRIVRNPKDGTESTLTWEDHEVQPGDSAWGTRGFTCTTLERAYAKLSELINTQPTQPAVNEQAQA